MKKAKINIKLLEKYFNSLSPDFMKWEVDLLAKISERNFLILVDKTNYSYFFINENKINDFYKVEDRNRYENLEITTKNLKDMVDKKTSSFKYKINLIKEWIADDEIISDFFSHPVFTNSFVEIKNNNILNINEKKIVSLFKDDFQPKLMSNLINFPEYDDFLQLWLDYQNKNIDKIKNFNEDDEKLLEKFFYTLFNKRAYFNDASLKTKSLINEINKFETLLINYCLEQIQLHNYDNTFLILETYMKCDNNMLLYSLDECCSVFKIIAEKILELPQKEYNEFKLLLKSFSKDLLEYIEEYEKLQKRSLIKENIDFSLQVQTVIELDINKIEKKLIRKLEEGIDFEDSKNFRVEREQNMYTIRHSLPLKNITNEDVVGEIINFLINPNLIPEDMTKYFRELDLKEGLKKNDNNRKDIRKKNKL